MLNYVYYYRFHALAIELESALEDVTAPCATADFKLDATRVLIKVLAQVISDSMHKFTYSY